MTENEKIVTTLTAVVTCILTALVMVVIQDQRPFLVAARVTTVQRSATRTYRCGKGMNYTCTEPVQPAVHFVYDGKPAYYSVSGDLELQPFRHWGCYWLRVAVGLGDTGKYELKTVVSEAPEQACSM
ncbi:MAG: hypothetical protein E6R04_01280 [Spirochaetes bacterium]|nr:MAG: hypothetical protein E6R04_01280 [Spirochaetota bacterium]